MAYFNIWVPLKFKSNKSDIYLLLFARKWQLQLLMAIREGEKNQANDKSLMIGIEY